MIEKVHGGHKEDDLKEISRVEYPLRNVTIVDQETEAGSAVASALGDLLIAVERYQKVETNLTLNDRIFIDAIRAWVLMKGLPNGDPFANK